MSNTIQPRTRNCIPWAMDWVAPFNQNQRKLRFRSARNVWSFPFCDVNQGMLPRVRRNNPKPKISSPAFVMTRAPLIVYP